MGSNHGIIPLLWPAVGTSCSLRGRRQQHYENMTRVLVMSVSSVLKHLVRSVDRYVLQGCVFQGDYCPFIQLFETLAASESKKVIYNLILCVERCDHDFEIITTRIVC